MSSLVAEATPGNPLPVTVTVQDANHVPVDYDGAYAYNEALDAWYGGTLNGSGQTVFTLPAGGYRFAAWVKGILYWSGSSNTCLIPGCTSDAVTLPTATVTVTVQDLNGVKVDSEAVYGYNASLDAWYIGTPNGSGQTVFELPVASYQFLAVVHGNYYMGSNTCTIPGCATYTVTVPALVTVTVQDANGVKLDNELVYAYNGVADAWVWRDTEREWADRVHAAGGELPVPGGGERRVLLERNIGHLHDPGMCKRHGDRASAGDSVGERI